MKKSTRDKQVTSSDLIARGIELISSFASVCKRIVSDKKWSPKKMVVISPIPLSFLYDDNSLQNTIEQTFCVKEGKSEPSTDAWRTNIVVEKKFVLEDERVVIELIDGEKTLAQFEDFARLELQLPQREGAFTCLISNALIQQQASGHNRTTKLRSIDLFAGIGGIRLGFEKAFGEQIETSFVSEWDLAAQKTYGINFSDTISIAGDITKVSELDIPPFDICLAGFPCQAFSLAGQRKGFADDYRGMSRGTLFFDVVRICYHHKPKVIFCENVKGLTIHDKGRTFKIIVETLEKMGYTTHTKVLNSKAFGVPQNRERIYIVAFRNDIDSSTFAFPVPHTKKVSLRDIIEKKPVSAKYYLSTCYMETLRRHKAHHESLGHGFGYEVRSLDGIAGAIVCGGMGRERNLIIDDRLTNYTPVTRIKGEVNRDGIRKMTPREWARLQGFPDSFKLVLSDVHLYKQFGNSVTVPVITAIATQIRKVLNHE